LSELGEVLQFLDTSAKKQEQTKNAIPSSVPTHSLSAAGGGTDMKKEITNENMSVEVASEKFKQNELKGNHEQIAQKSSFSSSSSSSSSSSVAVTAATSRPPRHQRFLKQQDEEKEDVAVENVKEDEDDDDDNSWRKQRNTMKNKSTPAAFTPTSSYPVAPHSSVPKNIIQKKQSEDMEVPEVKRKEEIIQLLSTVTSEVHPSVEKKIKNREDQQPVQHPQTHLELQQTSSSPTKEENVNYHNYNIASDSLLLEEIIPDLSIDEIPVSSGSLLSSAAGRRSKGGNSGVGVVNRK
jgi:hypothetical protein